MTAIPAAARPDDWLGLRAALWPHCPMARQRREIAAQSADPGRCAAFLALAGGNEAIGLIELSLRGDYVNGASSSPVAFVEGLYVAPEHRRAGMAALLLDAAKTWARGHGCAELASDTSLDNLVSQQAHLSLGFEETERVVFYRMPL
ncbi:aminoglycoside 6'-acetyltransferase [Chromobacterium sp. ATCC 53434]|uniref:aminoglycoside 6'-N-acetyltransferase n=1 Tax=Chromobacterium TaxID=535 RepID=UPI000C7833C5|nr:aminoglycoside 6'-N-acetyltransferase [Chromobacterium sp. ATCC 53434]AUH53090.1 aminoglycoside 6'-acetyltransferase [Chromobacterium sp. ATCC 53434]